jgi:hypothetical protein
MNHRLAHLIYQVIPGYGQDNVRFPASMPNLPLADYKGNPQISAKKTSSIGGHMDE